MLILQRADVFPGRDLEPQFTGYIFLIYSANIAITAVFAVVAVISQNKIFPCLQSDGIGCHARIIDGGKILALLISLSIDQDPAIHDLDSLSRKPDHPADMKSRIVTAVCTEYDNISPLR